MAMSSVADLPKMGGDGNGLASGEGVNFWWSHRDKYAGVDTGLPS